MYEEMVNRSLPSLGYVDASLHVPALRSPFGRSVGRPRAMMPALGRARLGLLVAVCLAGEVAPPLLVRTPKKKARGVAVGPSGEALAASVGRGLFEDRAGAQPKGNGSDGRSLRDRITAPPTSYPTVTYGGVLDAPLILPPSGAMNAAVGVTFLHSLPDITIHCTQDGSTPTRWSPRYQSGGMIHMSGTQHPR